MTNESKEAYAEQKNEIKCIRIASELSQREAAKLIGVSKEAWKKWEQGVNPMAPWIRELFLIKTNQHPEYILRSKKFDEMTEIEQIECAEEMLRKIKQKALTEII